MHKSNQTMIATMTEIDLSSAILSQVRKISFIVFKFIRRFFRAIDGYKWWVSSREVFHRDSILKGWNWTSTFRCKL